MARYVVRHTSGFWYFRRSIPRGLQHRLRSKWRKEIRLSLRTRSLSAARRRVPLCLLVTDHLLHRCAVADTQSDVERAIELYEEKLRAGLDALEALDTAQQSGDPRKVDLALELCTLVGDEALGLAAKHYESTQSPSSHCAKNNGESVTPPLSTPAWGEAVVPLVEEYLGKKEATDQLAVKTLEEYRHILTTFLRLAEVERTSEITSDALRAYSQRVACLPLNSGRAVRTGEGKASIGQTTQNKHLKVTKSFLLWLEELKILPSGSAKVLKAFQPTKPKRNNYEAFTGEELVAIFQHPIWAEGRFKAPHMYWVPLIGLFSGARLGEICQLRSCDVEKLDGVWCFTFTHEAGSLKNESSRRSVPIHKRLISLGITRFAQRADGEELLFLELSKNKSLSSPVSKWFARILQAVGVKKRAPTGRLGRNKSFHSFRSTLATELHRRGIGADSAAVILGHATTGITYGTYGKHLTVSDRLQFINKCELVTIDLPSWGSISAHTMAERRVGIKRQL